MLRVVCAANTNCLERGKEIFKKSFASLCVVKQTMNSQKRLRDDKEMAQPKFTVQICRKLWSIMISHSEIQGRKPSQRPMPLHLSISQNAQVSTL